MCTVISRQSSNAADSASGEGLATDGGRRKTQPSYSAHQDRYGMYLSIKYDDDNNTHTQPFYGCLDFVRYKQGEPVPEIEFSAV